MPNTNLPYDRRSSFEQSMEFLERRQWERRQAEREIERIMREHPPQFRLPRDENNTPSKDDYNAVVDVYFDHMRQILSAAGYSSEYIEHMLTLPIHSSIGEQDRILGLHGIEVKRGDDDEWEATIR